MKKIKYEKPTSLDAGQAATILGARCSDGTSATLGECVAGYDPTLVPACQPAGVVATNYCSVGSTNTIGNCEAGGVARGCYSTGTTPA